VESAQNRKGFGWVKDDYNPKAVYHKPRLVKLPDHVDLSSIIPSVRDQGQIGSCTGFGIGGILGATDKQNGEWVDWYSPEWIYNGARFIEGDLSQDAGAQPDDCFTWLADKGCLYEKYWQYNPLFLDTENPNDFVSAAIKYPSFQAVRVDNGVQGIMSALAEGHPVALGGPWFDKWMNPPDGVLANVSAMDSIAGGHETFLYGYDSSTQRLYGQNSWGTGWGSGGHYLMPFTAIDVFKQLGGYDAHYIVWDKNPVPPTPNPPSPSPKNWIAVLVAAIASVATFLYFLFTRFLPR
jgi:hypothetical protein